MFTKIIRLVFNPMIRTVKKEVLMQILEDNEVQYASLNLEKIGTSLGKAPDIFYAIRNYKVGTVSLHIGYTDNNSEVWNYNISEDSIQDFMRVLNKYELDAAAAGLIKLDFHCHYVYRVSAAKAKYFLGLSNKIVHDISSFAEVKQYLNTWYDKHPELKF